MSGLRPLPLHPAPPSLYPGGRRAELSPDDRGDLATRNNALTVPAPFVRVRSSAMGYPLDSASSSWRHGKGGGRPRPLGGPCLRFQQRDESSCSLLWVKQIPTPVHSRPNVLRAQSVFFCDLCTSCTILHKAAREKLASSENNAGSPACDPLVASSHRSAPIFISWGDRALAVKAFHP
jgi:hypothetical protein